MTFLAISTGAILGVFTGKFVYLMTQRKQLSVGSQYDRKNGSLYNEIKK